MSCPGASATAVTGISDTGAVIGAYIRDDRIHGFVRDAGGNCVTLDKPDASNTLLADINNRGQIVGTYTDNSGAEHPFLYENGKFVEFDGALAAASQPFGGYSGASAMGINNSGRMVGLLQIVNGPDKGFIRHPDGTVTVVAAGPIAGLSFEFSGINESGWIAGMASVGGNKQQAFVRSPTGAYESFDGHSGACESQLLGINARGEAVGVYHLPTAGGECDPLDNPLFGTGFYRSPEGVLLDLTHPDATRIAAFKINAPGVITGAWWDLQGNMRGFVARKSALF